MTPTDLLRNIRYDLLRELGAQDTLPNIAPGFLGSPDSPFRNHPLTAPWVDAARAIRDENTPVEPNLLRYYEILPAWPMIADAIARGTHTPMHHASVNAGVPSAPSHPKATPSSSSPHPPTPKMPASPSPMPTSPSVASPVPPSSAPSTPKPQVQVPPPRA